MNPHAKKTPYQVTVKGPNSNAILCTSTQPIGKTQNINPRWKQDGIPRLGAARFEARPHPLQTEAMEFRYSVEEFWKVW
jgi:hypothetical protein